MHNVTHTHTEYYLSFWRRCLILLVRHNESFIGSKVKVHTTKHILSYCHLDCSFFFSSLMFRCSWLSLPRTSSLLRLCMVVATEKKIVSPKNVRSIQIASCNINNKDSEYNLCIFTTDQLPSSYLFLTLLFVLFCSLWFCFIYLFSSTDIFFIFGPFFLSSITFLPALYGSLSVQHSTERGMDLPSKLDIHIPFIHIHVHIFIADVGFFFRFVETVLCPF